VTGLIVMSAVLIAARVVALVVLLCLPAPDACEARVHVDPCLGPMAFPAPPEPSPESVLVARLTCGAITREQYQREMAALAAGAGVGLTRPPHTGRKSRS
jgi:hypothetical protein